MSDRVIYAAMSERACGSSHPLVLEQVIKKHKNCHQQYVDRLLEAGAITEDEVSSVHNRIQATLQEEFDLAKTYKPEKRDWLSHVWEGFMTPAQRARVRNTGAAFRCLYASALQLSCWQRRTSIA